MNPKEWIGKAETVDDVVTATPYAACRQRSTASRASAGGNAAASAMALALLPAALSAIRSRPRRPCETRRIPPPIPLPRRMWAGSQLQFLEPLRIGDAVTRTSTIEDVTEKSGRSGPLVFVRVRHEIRAATRRRRRSWNFTTSSIARRPVPGDAAPPPKPAPARSCLGTALGSRRRAAIPLLGTDVQQPPHPLRSPLCHDRRRLPGSHRARPLDRDAAARSPAPPVARGGSGALRIPRRSSAVRSPPFFVCGEPQQMARRSGSWARDHEGFLAMDATRPRALDGRRIDAACPSPITPSSRRRASESIARATRSSRCRCPRA